METSKAAASKDSIDEKASSFDFLLIAPTRFQNYIRKLAPHANTIPTHNRAGDYP